MLDQIGPNITNLFYSSFLPNSTQLVIDLAPIMLMVLLFTIFWGLWVDYIRGSFFLSLKYSVLELRLPKDTFKSPKAMEVFLNAIHNTSDGSLYKQYWDGEVRPWYSLEIASIEGAVKFHIWTEDRRKQGVMSALYSQYPEIEIKVVPDYACSVHFDPKIIRIWAAEFVYTNKSPAYPIKTYVDYGLDKDPKEEFKVDPLLPLLEFLGSVGPNQQVWMQIMVRAHKDDQSSSKHWFKRADNWKAAVAKEINEVIMLRDPKTKVAGMVNPDTGFAKLPSLTEGEREIVLALERNMAKPAFDVGIRFLYITPKEEFNTVFGVSGVISSMKQFNHEHMNGFKPNGKKWHPRLGDPWLDYKNMRRDRYGKLALRAYKQRSFFYDPFPGKPLVMNTEALATLYHFPGSVSQTPTLERVPSRKAKAPSNLPTA